MTDRQNRQLEYPIVNDKASKDFIDKLQEAMDYQKNNPIQVNKKAFNNQKAQGQKIVGLQLTDQIFNNCDFSFCRLTRCVFTGCTFIQCNFTAATLYNIQFKNDQELNKKTTFTKCNFTDAVMQDVNAAGCIKSDCIFKNVDFSKNVIGLQQDENNVIKDSVQDANNQKIASVYPLVKEILANWNQVEQMSFQLTGTDQNNAAVKCGLAIYPNEQKNDSEQKDIWQFDFFYGDQSILMHDFNLYGMSKEQIEQTINKWKDQDLVSESKVIIERILNIIGDNEK